jgi:hypothetical protein
VVERGWFTTRAASLARRARRATIGRRARWRPPTSRPQQATPKRTTPISGKQKLRELAAVAEIESGRNAIASTMPSEMIESVIASRPRLAPLILRKVPILTR